MFNVFTSISIPSLFVRFLYGVHVLELTRIKCTGSHGISIGSLGQYVGEVDIVENIHVYNVSMIQSGTSARIKVWQDAIPNADGTIPQSSGGGSGYVRNVTYSNMHDTNDDCNYTMILPLT